VGGDAREVDDTLRLLGQVVVQDLEWAGRIDPLTAAHLLEAWRLPVDGP
jgi:hypothetical protein